jgi:inhibitor of KinA
MQRLQTPRLRVPAGSVGIGGAQTGIYPRSGPGGWRILGRTQTVLFDPRHSPPSLLSPGDRVRFVPVAGA